MRISRIPKRELDICGRLRFAREEVSGLTQAKCAGQIGLDRTTLANYEMQRTPLRYEVALRFCRQFIISEEWLATGRHDLFHAEGKARGVVSGLHAEDLKNFDNIISIRHCLDLLSDHAALHIKPGSLFSVAYDITLAARYGELVKEWFWVPRIVFSDVDETDLAANYLKVIHERQFAMLRNEALRRSLKPPHLWRPYLLHVFNCSQWIFAKMVARSLSREVLASPDFLRETIREFLPESGDYGDGQKKELTKTASTPSLTGEVKNQWPELKRRLQETTAKAGQKSKLADFLRMDLTRVSQWLTPAKSAREPGAEYALQMLRWVEQQERHK